MKPKRSNHLSGEECQRDSVYNVARGAVSLSEFGDCVQLETPQFRGADLEL